jgi:hypothetical protein
MFGMSMGKFLLLAIILLIVWQGVKFVTRVGAVRQALRRAAEQVARQPDGSRTQAVPAEDLMKCSSCGAFVPVGTTTSCGRSDCPRRR